MARISIALLGATLMVALSGCFTASEGGTNFTVAQDAAPHFDGDGDYVLNVRVVDWAGAPIPGAAVVFFTSETDFSNDGWWANSFTNYEPIGAVRTGADGMGSAALQAGVVHVAAGGLSNYTVEVKFGIAIANSGESTVEVRLYPNKISMTQDVTVNNLIGRAGLQGPDSQAFRLQFSDHSATDKALHERLLQMDLDLTWTNGMESAADLFVGIAAGDNDPFKTGGDSQQLPGDGANTESVSVSVGELEPARQAVANAGAYAVVMSDWVSLGFNGVSATFTVDAEFKGSQFTIE